MGEGVTARRAAVDQPLQPAEVGHPFLLQLAGEGNRLAIAVEGHQIGHRLRLAGDPQFEAVQQAIENMRRVELAGHQLVAHRRPAGFLTRHQVMPYFWSNPFAAAMASGAQSVSGINPTRTRVCSGLSEPPAQAACITPGSSIAPPSAAPACSKRRREIENLSPISAPPCAKKKKRPTVHTHCRTPLSTDTRTAIGSLPGLLFT